MLLNNIFKSGFRRSFVYFKDRIFPLRIFVCKESITYCNNNMNTSSESKYNWGISLVCPDGNHDPIPLPHKEALFIGRSPETRIVDPRCLRKQVKLFGDLITGDIQVTQLGSNSSVLDGIEMIKDKVYHMKHNSTLNLLATSSKYKLQVKHLSDNQQPSETKTSQVSEEKRKKNSPKSETSSRYKRKSSFEDTDKHSSKKPRLSETELDKTSERKRESDSKDRRKSKSKEKDSRHKDKDGSFVNKEKSGAKILGDESSIADDSENHLKSVAEKLNALKSSTKSSKTPAKSEASTSKEKSRKGESDSPVGNKGPAPSSKWDQYESLYVFTSKGLEGRRRVAGFDIDGTIIEPKSGKKFPTHPGDWRLKFNQIAKKIREHHEDGYKIVFFTNEMGVSQGKTNMSELKTKFSGILDEIHVPVQIFVATKGGLYSKPCTGMWEFLADKGNDGVPIEISQSFYVGDAAGRLAGWAPKMKKDFANSDRLFALNIGIQFHTPEEFFMGYPTAKFRLPVFDPRNVSSETPLLDPVDAKLTSSTKEVVLLAGCPASGKSFFSKEYLVSQGYGYVSRDSLGSWIKCDKTCNEHLQKGNSVVIDNPNSDLESRERYLTIASSAGVPCRCFVFNMTLEQAKHNEKFREITDESHRPVNDIIMNSFKGRFKPPKLSEGFTEIVKVNFVPKFKDEREEKLYRMFLMG